MFEVRFLLYLLLLVTSYSQAISLIVIQAS